MRNVLTRLLVVSCVLGGWACVGEELIYSGSWVKPQAPLRLVPGKFSEVSLKVRNEGTATWSPEDVYVEPTVLPSSWVGGFLRLSRETEPGEVGTFKGGLSAGASEGWAEVSWAVHVRGAPFGGSLVTPVEVTCSDGAFCNGVESFVEGRCVPGGKPCGDSAECTEEAGCLQ